MLATFAAAALIGGASAVVGEAIARALGLERGRGWSPAVGLAALILIALGAVKLPGHGTAGAIAIAVATLVAVVVVATTGGLSRPSPQAIAMTAIALAAACIPYLSSGRFGILAVSYNNDLSAHIPWAEWLQEPGLPGGFEPVPGYPVGPHSLVASLSGATGIDAEWGFAGLLLVLPALVAWAAVPLLGSLPRTARSAGALLVAFAYTMAAFYAQANFKELSLTLFLLAALGIASTAPRPAPARLGAQIGLLGAGIAVTFSYGGLAWPVLAAGAWGALALGSAVLGPGPGAARRGRVARWLRDLRSALPAAVMAIALGAVAMLLDVQRLIDSLSVFGSSPAGTGSLTTQNIGHLAGPVPKDEIFGFWPREDFRFGFEPTTANKALALLATVVVVAAGLWWLWRRSLAVPGAAIAAVALLVHLGRSESAYTASKALAPAGALAMLIAVRPLLGGWRPPPRLPQWPLRAARIAVAVAFVGGALWSSYLVLRGAQVGTREHGDELATLSEQIEGGPVWFLGNDDFIRSEMPGIDVWRLPAPPAGKTYAYADPFDFDSVPADDLREADHAIVTRTAFRSEPPSAFRRVGKTASFELWERRAEVEPRRILREGSSPGAVLDCSTPPGRALADRRGIARIWTAPPIVARPPAQPFPFLPGDARAMTLRLPPGRWQLSVQYTAPQAIEVEADGKNVGTLRPSLSRIGPYWRVGEVVRERRGPVRLRFEMRSDPLGAKTHAAAVAAVAAVRMDAPRRTVALGQACGKYVDWYRLSTAPSPGG